MELRVNLAEATGIGGRPADVELDVVIPTRDRPDRLAACLDALHGQSFDRFGVIVVDDGGQVPAADLVPPDLHPRFGLTFVRNPTSMGPGASRNRGVAHSAARHIVFLDDDCLAEPELVARHHDVLAQSDGPVVSLGPILSLPGRRLSAWTHWDAEHLEREYSRLARGTTRPQWRHLYTGNVGVRRADFLAVSGFDTRFSRQEDVELGYRLHRFGCRFAFDSRAVVRHDSDRSLSSWRRIPAATARFDVLMDQLVPDSGRLNAARRGLANRHWALRVTRRALRAEPARRLASAGAIGAGCVLHALRIDKPSLAALSLFWDLTYSRELEAATAGGPDGQAGGHRCT